MSIPPYPTLATSLPRLQSALRDRVQKMTDLDDKLAQFLSEAPQSFDRS